MKNGSIKHRFTLIEMLVVIAIIGILASLLMPALQSAMDSAKMVLCTNNMRQVGMVMTRYADEYNNFLPPRICGGDFIDIRSGGDYGNDGDFITFIQGYDKGLQIANWGSAQYVRDPIFICPSDGYSSREATNGNNRKVSYDSHFFVWRDINDRNTPNYNSGDSKCLKITRDIKFPSKTGLLGEAAGLADGRVMYVSGPRASATYDNVNGVMAWGESVWYVRMSHNAEFSSNFLYFDNHIEPLFYPEQKESLDRTWVGNN